MITPATMERGTPDPMEETTVPVYLEPPKAGLSVMPFSPQPETAESDATDIYVTLERPPSFGRPAPPYYPADTSRSAGSAATIPAADSFRRTSVAISVLQLGGIVGDNEKETSLPGWTVSDKTPALILPEKRASAASGASGIEKDFFTAANKRKVTPNGPEKSVAGRRFGLLRWIKGRSRDPQRRIPLPLTIIFWAVILAIIIIAVWFLVIYFIRRSICGCLPGNPNGPGRCVRVGTAVVTAMGDSGALGIPLPPEDVLRALQSTGTASCSEQNRLLELPASGPGDAGVYQGRVRWTKVAMLRLLADTRNVSLARDLKSAVLAMPLGKPDAPPDSLRTSVGGITYDVGKAEIIRPVRPAPAPARRPGGG